MKKRLMKFFVVLVLLSVFSIGSYGQQTDRKFLKYEGTEDRVKVFVSDGFYEILPFNDKIVHTAFYPEKKDTGHYSFAVNNKPAKPVFAMEEQGNFINIKLKGLKVVISKNPFRISYYNKANQLLITENKASQGNMEGASLNFSVSPDEVFYGGGSRALGMNRRGNRLKLFNEPHYGYQNRAEVLNYSLPVMISSKKYAVLFDNASAGYLDLDSRKTNSIDYGAVGGNMNYYVISGDEWFDLTNQYTWLTGRQPLPPRWAFGNYSSRFGYHSQREAEKTVDMFFKDNIPVDAVVIDIYWFGKEIKGTLGNLEWDLDSFPEPEKMISKFKERGVQTILVTEPFILNTSKKWNEAVQNKILGTDSIGNPYVFEFYFGNTGIIDLFKPEAREWFWNIYKNLSLQGVAGWWGDLGEPEKHPAGIHYQAGKSEELHNAYGHEWARLIFEGYQKDFPEVRPFILMRAGYAGSQRYGIIPWTGDVSRSWGGLVPQPEISLQMGMQGIAYMHSDLGGFSEVKEFDPELYTRWLQYGVFQPIFRPHAFESIPSEPVFQDAKTKDLARKSIELRYRLLPYNYNLAFANSQTGKPLMIPLFYVEPSNPLLLGYDNAYLWGDAFLVSPVKEKGKKKQEVYFPRGSTWYDFYGNEFYLGGKTYSINLKEENIPVFVKGGSFIPMISKIMNTSHYSLQRFELHYYTDPMEAKSSYRLYNDDGISPNAFERGDYEMMEFESVNKPALLNIGFVKIHEGEGYKNAGNSIDLKIHKLKRKPVSISLDGKKLDHSVWKWDDERKLLEIEIICRNKKGLLEIVK